MDSAFNHILSHSLNLVGKHHGHVEHVADCGGSGRRPVETLEVSENVIVESGH
jgi:hypothetical protein